MGLVSGFDITITLWFATYLTEKGLTTIQNVGFIIGLYYGAVIVCRFILGFIVNKKKSSKNINCSLIMVFILTLILEMINNYTILGIIAVGLGLSISSLHPLTLYENHMVYTDNYASKITSFQIAIGSLIVPAGIGVLMANFGTEVFW